MTERILPAGGVQARPRRATDGFRDATVPRVSAAPSAAAHRSAPFLTTPARTAILLGGSAAVYALTLAAVAGMQSSADAALAARRQPWVDTLAETRAANDAVEQSLLQLDEQLGWLGEDYAEIGIDVAAYQARLDSLAALVADVEGSAAALPTRITLPTVTVRGPVTRSAAPPVTTAKTRASGG